MNKQYYPALDETLIRRRLPNGLTVLVVPKPGFTKKLAYFVADFGAVHTDFTLEGISYRVPAGIAHFLEHKIFDLPDRDVAGEFAALGAAVNAFTSYDMTAYYFSCTENFDACLRLLLEFVSTPYFTDESVEKELGIIDQEIGMNEDDPGNQVFEQLTKAMFDHPIRQPILGTSEDIRKITPELLHTCHRAFYTPGNMILCVVGDVDADRIADTALDILGSEARPVGEKADFPQEDMAVRSGYTVKQMDVAMPMFNLGFKCEPLGKGVEAIAQEVIGDLAAEVLFGEASALYLNLYGEGLIDSSFGGGFETIDGCALLSCSGDSDNAEAVRQAILTEAQRICAEGIDEAQFHRLKRSTMGRRIRDLDSFDSTCFRLCAYHLSDFDYFRFPEIYNAITPLQVQQFLERIIRPERCSLSVIETIKEDTV